MSIIGNLTTIVFCASVAVGLHVLRGPSTPSTQLASFTPMECRSLTQDYTARWTKPESVTRYDSTKMVVRNEIDGMLVTLTKESEASWVCKELGPEVTLSKQQ